MNRITLLTIFFVLLQTNFGFAIDIPVYDIENGKCNPNDFKVGLLIDSSRDLGIDEIVKLKSSYQLVESRYVVKEIQKSYWFIFKIKNSTSELLERIVGFDEVFMKTVDIFYKNDSVWYHDQGGLDIPMESRSLKNRCFLFKVSIKPHETKTIYLKMDTDFALVSGITIEEPQLFFENEQKRTMGYWSYFGAAIAIFLYNLFLLFHIREKVYLYYVIYAGSFIVFSFLYSGYSQYFISNTKLLYDLDSSLAIMGAFLTLFTRELLNTKKLGRWIDSVLICISIIYAIFAVLVPISIYFYQWLVIYGIPSVLFLLFTGIYSWSKKMPLAKYYITAMSGYLIGLILISALNLELIPYNPITRYGFMIGSFIELSVFSLALGYRVKLLQNEKNTYHIKLLTAERGIKEKLELQVAQRTVELSNSVSELNVTNDKLQKLSNFKEDMTNMMVHDLKNPISAIISLPEEMSQHEQRQITDYSAYAMLNLVMNILDVQKYQDSNLKLHKLEQNIMELWQNAISQLKYLAEQKNIEIQYEPNIEIHTIADKELIARVLVNVLSNALKYTRNNGKVTLHAEETKQNYLKITIEDNGYGISEEHLQSIFTKYQQVGEKMSNSTGLGLTFCKIAIEAHGGEIGIESELNIGTKLWFTLPNTQLISTKSKATDENTILVFDNVNELKVFLPLFKETEVYQISDQERIFETIKTNGQGNESWVKALHNSVINCNEKQYKELLDVLEKA